MRSSNATDTAIVTEARSERAVDLIVTVVYGPAAAYAKPRLDEGDAKNPRHVYGLTKHLAECEAAAKQQVMAE
jgi:nucleoside-diphosphate-sugar epimerase